MFEKQPPLQVIRQAVHNKDFDEARRLAQDYCGEAMRGYAALNTNGLRLDTLYTHKEKAKALTRAAEHGEMEGSLQLLTWLDDHLSRITDEANTKLRYAHDRSERVPAADLLVDEINALTGKKYRIDKKSYQLEKQ